MIQTQTYVRKPLYVEAIQVTAENFNELALWCSGTIQEVTEKTHTFQFISVRVTNPMNPRQGQARVGDWILVSDRGYKVYTSKAFEKSFDPNPTKGPYGAVGDPIVVPVDRGYTAGEIQGMLTDEPVVPAEPDATRDSRDDNNAVGTGPMPEQPMPTDVEEPAKAPTIPANLDTIHDPNVVYPNSPETTV